MIRPKLKHLILDLGGVVYRIDWTLTNRLLGVDESTTWWTWPEYDAYERGQIDTLAFQKIFESKLGAKWSTEVFKSSMQKMIVAPLPRLEELLERLRVPVYALSNTNEAHYEYFINDHVMKPFTKIFTSFELGLRKPQAEIYTKTLQIIGADSSEVLFIDDREDNLSGARSVGLLSAQSINDSERLETILKEFDLLV